MKRSSTPPSIDSEPVIATWELWTVAQTLIAARGEGAETHAEARLAEAQAQGDEANEIVWTGVITQLQRIRGGN